MNAALVSVLLGALLVVILRRRGGRQSPEDVRRDLAMAAVHMARALREGANLAEALACTAEQHRGPLGEVLKRSSDAIVRGTSIDEALGELAERGSRGAAAGTRVLDGEGLALVSVAARFGQSTGGDVAAAFDGVATALLDSAETSEEMAALVSQARASTIVLCVLPVLGVALFAAVEPSVAAQLFGTEVGWACLLAAFTLDLTAWVVARRLVMTAVRAG